MNRENCCVLIPSLDPDEKLPKYVEELIKAQYGLILVIDDGSGPEYQPIFERIASWPGCHVLHHEVNRGKGAALRTGFAYILEQTKLEGVITADSDGQHTVADTAKLAERLDGSRAELLLGSRDFSRRSKQVPPKSRFGNRLTSGIFALLYSHWLPDTQTGLRGMSRAMLRDCLEITGDRFEYEMNQLILRPRGGQEQASEIDLFLAVVHQFHLDVIEHVRRGKHKGHRQDHSGAEHPQHDTYRQFHRFQAPFGWEKTQLL